LKNGCAYHWNYIRDAIMQGRNTELLLPSLRDVQALLVSATKVWARERGGGLQNISRPTLSSA
jgi:hypothetical protein